MKEIVDGDGVKFADGEEGRLVNVRAPEKNEPGYARAKKSLSSMIARSGGEVNCRSVGRDKYGRLLVEISNHEGSINKRLREKGYTNKGN